MESAAPRSDATTTSGSNSASTSMCAQAGTDHADRSLHFGGLEVKEYQVPADANLKPVIRKPSSTTSSCPTPSSVPSAFGPRSSTSSAPLLQSIFLDRVSGEKVEVRDADPEGARVQHDDAWRHGCYQDEVTGEPIPRVVADAAAEEECASMEAWGVWDVVPREQAYQRTGKAPTRTRWVRVNKGDAQKPDIRARLVGMEVAYQKDVDFFSATPPLEALKSLLSWVSTRPGKGKQEHGARKLMVVDAKKAHIHAWAQRELYIELPPERAQPGMCGRLRRSLYGFRDAPALWEAYLASELERLGFVRGTACAATYYHPKWDVRAVVHGDDFCFAGHGHNLAKVRAAIDQAFLLKDVGTLGWEKGDVQELKVLNRVVRLVKDNGKGETGVAYEADPRHAELLVAALGPNPRKGITTPGTKLRRGRGDRFEEELGEDVLGNVAATESDASSDVRLLQSLHHDRREDDEPTCEEEAVEESTLLEVKAGEGKNKTTENPEDGEADEEELPPDLAHLFRAGAARANYLAMDRPDLSWAAKELCRRMSAPRREDLQRLRRLARYLLEAPRLVAWFVLQEEGLPLRAFGDTDFAGCPDTRRSTSGGCLLLGRHCLKHWSVTQKTVTLSSGEAELAGCVKAAAEGLGLQALLHDLGVEVHLQLWSDSAAAIGIAKRSGIGRIRHLAVALLWIQERLRSGDFELFKVAGETNPADLFTKALSRQSVDKHLTELDMHFEAGRAPSAPEVSSHMAPFLASVLEETCANTQRDLCRRKTDGTNPRESPRYTGRRQTAGTNPRESPRYTTTDDCTAEADREAQLNSSTTSSTSSRSASSTSAVPAMPPSASTRRSRMRSICTRSWAACSCSGCPSSSPIPTLCD